MTDKTMGNALADLLEEATVEEFDAAVALTAELHDVEPHRLKNRFLSVHGEIAAALDARDRHRRIEELTEKAQALWRKEVAEGRLYFDYGNVGMRIFDGDKTFYVVGMCIDRPANLVLLDDQGAAHRLGLGHPRYDALFRQVDPNFRRVRRRRVSTDAAE